MNRAIRAIDVLFIDDSPG
jgi:hypothetical protein